MCKVDNIVAISEYVKSSIIDIYKINEKKITVINRGTDIDFFNPKMLEGVLREFPDLLKINDSKIYDTPLEKKLTVKQDYIFGKQTKIFLNFLYIKKQNNG